MKIEKFSEGNLHQISQSEKELGILLPTDYKDFLLQNNGAKFTDGYFFVEELDQEIIMDTLFGIDLEKEELDIKKVNKEFEDDIPNNALLIGDDPGGGFILLINDGENNGIYYYDHSYFFEQSSDEKNTYFISDSFCSFLDMLQNRTNSSNQIPIMK